VPEVKIPLSRGEKGECFIIELIVLMREKINKI
jgi:hypothetical protein